MNNIRRLREKSGITQIELAKQCNIDRSTVAKWETEKSMPRSDKLLLLSTIFNCSIDDLIKK